MKRLVIKPALWKLITLQHKSMFKINFATLLRLQLQLCAIKPTSIEIRGSQGFKSLQGRGKLTLSKGNRYFFLKKWSAFLKENNGFHPDTNETRFCIISNDVNEIGWFSKMSLKPPLLKISFCNFLIFTINSNGVWQDLSGGQSETWWGFKTKCQFVPHLPFFRALPTNLPLGA